MKTPLMIALLILLVLLGIYLLSKSPLIAGKTYDWSLQMTKPLDYDISVNKISYHKADKEIYRYTSMNVFSGWSGVATGSVLHNKPTNYLPDTVKLSWTENNTDITYATEFVFPKEKVLDYWNKNYELLKQKRGADYQKGQLSLELGIAPDGIITLWFSDMDVNTSYIALEVESYKANTKDSSKQLKAKLNSTDTVLGLRFGAPHFYTFEADNIVAISVLYHNGEANTISLKNENDSILESVNKERGWGLVKNIIVHWFEHNGKGYKSTYKVNLQELTIKDSLEKFRNTDFVYLLDKQDTPDGEWNKLTNKHVFQLTEIERKTIN